MVMPRDFARPRLKASLAFQPEIIMKMTPVLLIASALLSPLAFAEGNPGTDKSSSGASSQQGKSMKHGMMMKHDCEEMEECFSEGLNLTNDQQQKIRNIMQEARKKRDELRDETYNDIKDVLTPEQARKLEAHRAEMMKYRAERMRERADRMEKRANDMKGQQTPSKSQKPDSGSGSYQ